MRTVERVRSAALRRKMASGMSAGGRIDKSSTPETTVQRADLLHGDEGLRIDACNFLLDAIDVTPPHAGDHERHGAVLPAASDFGGGVARRSDRFGDCASKPGADHP